MHNLKDPGYKLAYNRRHFDIAASRYDVATQLLSLGRDRGWKDRAFRMLSAELKARGRVIEHSLDLACGTGDMITHTLMNFPAVRATGVDISEQMLEKARARFAALALGTEVELISGDISNLGAALQGAEFKDMGEDEKYDLVTASYALRNAPNLEACLDGISNVLKPGGYLLVIDFIKPDKPLLASIHARFMVIWGGFCGFLLHFNPRIHSYLGGSLDTYIPESQVIELCEDRNLNLISRYTSPLKVSVLLLRRGGEL